MKRPWKKRAGGGAAVADPAETDLPTLLAEVERLTLANRDAPDPAREARILRLRHLAGLQRLHTTTTQASFVDASGIDLPQTATVPEVDAADVTPEILRAAILRDGCLLVRGLVPREDALSLADGIDTAFAERERVIHGEEINARFYAEFKPEPPNQDVMVRDWIRMGGGVLAADSPRLTFQMLELFSAAGIPQLVEGYLGEPGMLTLEKTTLRKAEPTVNGAWHQDGKFLGQVNAVNLWLSLSRCGDVAPGLDIVPRRLDDLVNVTTDEAVLDYQVSQSGAEAVAGPKGIVRPIFEPGDALLFDELMLHQTASDPSMPNPRYAVESWFFGASAFPEYVPIAV